MHVPVSVSCCVAVSSSGSGTALVVAATQPVRPHWCSWRQLDDTQLSMFCVRQLPFTGAGSGLQLVRNALQSSLSLFCSGVVQGAADVQFMNTSVMHQ
jgi:hypothetical protein